MFPPLSNEQLIEEIKKYKQKEDERVLELQKQFEKEEAKKKKQPNKKEAQKEEGENQNVIQKRPYYTRGWILIGFPGSEEQAKEFEQTLSGYMLEEELLNNEAEDKKRRAGVLAKAPEKPPAQSKFIEGGFDFVIKLEVSGEECLRRALGRRVDPNTGNIYHLQDNPPPANDTKLQDRLIPINDPDNTEEKLQEKIGKFEENIERLEIWYDRFGNEGAQVDCLLRIEGVGKTEEIHSCVDKHIEELLNYKMKEKYDKMLEESELKKLNELSQAAENSVKQSEAKEETKENTENKVTEENKPVLEAETKVVELIVMLI